MDSDTGKEKIFKQLKGTEFFLLQMVGESMGDILLHGDCFIPVRLSKGEAKCMDSKFQNPSGPFLYSSAGTLKCVVFYSLPARLSVLNPHHIKN